MRYETTFDIVLDLERDILVERNRRDSRYDYYPPIIHWINCVGDHLYISYYSFFCSMVYRLSYLKMDLRLRNETDRCDTMTGMIIQRNGYTSDKK